MDSIFNLVIILIPLSIFIGRAIVQARAKHEKRPPAPPITVHFEDDEPSREIGHWVVPDAPVAPAARAVKGPASKIKKTKTLVTPGLGVISLPKVDKVIKAPVSAPQAVKPVAQPAAQGSFNLNHLSPLKQAVVMSEILGPPKALQ